ncbi:MAG: IS30 family transposase [Clostridia bacterium]
MNNNQYTSEHQKGQHLSEEERYIIQIRLQDKWNINRIAKELGRPYNTVKNEIARGTVSLYNGKVFRYKANEGQRVYEEHRQNSRKSYKRLECSDFISYVQEQFKGEKKWSLDASVGYAKKNELFPRSEMVCTKTLYNYVDLQLISIKNIDLPEKMKRRIKAKKTRQNKKKLGESIENRAEEIEKRDEFGHWEIDSVLGSKNGDEPAICTIVERMTRNTLWLRVLNHSAAAITQALEGLKIEYGDKFSQVFKTITADNGSEFAELTKISFQNTKVYFTHPYSSWEKGTNECHNRLLRRFIPKGKSMANYTQENISFMSDWCNGLPRKILNYHTPEELFEAELDKIYCA